MSTDKKETSPPPPPPPPPTAPTDINIFEMIGELTESVKTIMKDTQQIRAVTDNFETFKKDINERFAKLSADVLINTEAIKTLEDVQKHNNNTHQSTNEKLSTRIGNISTNVIALKDDIEKQCTSIDTRFASLDSKFSSDAIKKSIDNSVASVVRRTVFDDDAIDKRIVELVTTKMQAISIDDEEITSKVAQKISAKYDPTNASIMDRLQVLESTRNINKSTASSTTATTTRKPVSYVDTNVNCDVLLITDSNGKAIKTDQLTRSHKCQRVTCYTLAHVHQLLAEATITSQPKKILLHVGTNDVDNAENAADLSLDLSKAFDALKKSFPTTRTYVSSIFVRKRKDAKIKQTIETVNGNTMKMADATPGLTYMNNSCITEEHLYDDKHIDTKGLFRFLCNIRFTLFGEIPTPRGGRQHGR